MRISTKIILLISVSLIFTSFIISILAVVRISQTGEMAIKKVENLSSENIRQMQRNGQKQAETFRSELLEHKKEYLSSQIQTAMSVLEKSYNDAHDPEKLKKIFKDQLQNSVNTAYGIIEAMEQRKDMSVEEKQAAASQIIKKLRYGPDNKDYFWINDMQPYMIMHPYKPELNGTDLSNFKDTNGKHLFVEFVKVCQKEQQGFVDYYWPKYGADKPQLKLSFVRLFKPWNWIIGSGVYLEIAEKQLKIDSASIIKEMKYGPDNKDYFWINDMQPRMIMHPYKPELNGKDLSELKDPEGKNLFVEFVRVCQEKQQGFVDYYWPKYGAEKPQPKLSFVRVFKPWNWVIGTGIYIDDIDAIIEARHQELKKQTATAVNNMEQRIAGIKANISEKVKHVLRRIIYFTFMLLALVWCITFLFTRRNITKPINRIIEGLTESTHQVAAAATQIAAGSQHMAESISGQAAAMQESSASLEQMSAMSSKTSELTSGAEELMNLNIEKSGRSLKALMGLTIDISQIEADSDKISQIINEIDAIAFQTNLLALNAAVEAARAGEAGKGFAVVANEVKSLAMRTTGAAKNTQELLSSTLDRVSNAAQSIQGVNNDFADIIESATVMGERTASITLASKEQSLGIIQLSKAANEIDKVTQQVAANAQESAASAEELSAQSEEMKAFVNALANVIGGKNEDK